MQNGFKGDLNALLKDVQSFNRQYGSSRLALQNLQWPSLEVTGMELTGATLENVSFRESRIAKSKFTSCAFIGSEFSQAEFEDAEFVDCRFDHAVFSASRFTRCTFRKCAFVSGAIESDGPSKSAFSESKFDSTRFSKVRLTDSEFGKSSFAGGEFAEVAFDDASFSDCRLEGTKLSGMGFKRLDMYDCELVKPDLEGFDLSKVAFIRCVISDIGMAPRGFGGDPSFRMGGVTFRNVDFDLEHVRGEFGIDGAEDCRIRNYRAGHSMVLHNAKLKNVLLENCRAGEIYLGLAEAEGSTFADVSADMLFLDKAEMKRCVFRNLTVKSFMRLDSAVMTDVKWESSRLEPGAEFSAKGTPYGDKPPF